MRARRRGGWLVGGGSSGLSFWRGVGWAHRDGRGGVAGITILPANRHRWLFAHHDIFVPFVPKTMVWQRGIGHQNRWWWHASWVRHSPRMSFQNKWTGQFIPMDYSITKPSSILLVFTHYYCFISFFALSTFSHVFVFFWQTLAWESYR